MGGVTFRILIVDDEALVATALQRVLGAAGFDVLAVHSAHAALSAIDSFVPHLVVSDLNMAVMTGEDLLAEVKQRAPHIRRALISATFDDTTPAPERCAPCTMLAKPWRSEELVRAVREIFGEGA